MSCQVPGAAGVSCNAPVAKHNQQTDTNTRVAKAVSDGYVTDDLQIYNPLLSFFLARGFMSEDTDTCARCHLNIYSLFLMKKYVQRTLYLSTVWGKN